jgi:carbon-monoxide dehydrogenase medium subunit
MAALDGVVVARSQRGTRRVSAAEFYQGVMTTALEEDEMVVAAELPVLPESTRSGFVEFSRRKGDFAIAMALVTYRLDEGKISDPRVAVGGAESHARRMSEVEDVLRGKAPGTDVFAVAAETAAAAVDPMEDINNTAAYRRGLVRALTQRALEMAE